MTSIRKKSALLLTCGAAGAVLWGACAVQAPPPECSTNHGDYSAKYYLKTSTDDSCVLPGELLTLEKYRPDGKRPQIGILPEQIASDATDILADFKTDEPENDFCSVADAEKTTVDIPEVTRKLKPAELDAGYADGGVFQLNDGGMLPLRADGGVAVAEAYTVSYQFSNIRLYSTPEVPNTQFQADLTYTQDNCTATYNVVALYPAIECETDLDCDPNRDLDAGRLFGSGINPGFDTFCDEETGHCQLKAETIGAETLKK